MPITRVVAAADILHNLQIKVGVTGVLPDESASTAPIGGDVDIADAFAPSAQASPVLMEPVLSALLCRVAIHDLKAV
jgi:hypothetical protein